MNRQLRANLMLSLASIVATFILIELGVRTLVEPSEWSYGTLLRRELPPRRITPWHELPAYDHTVWYANVVVDGQRISHGDQHGILRPDPLLGYSYETDAISSNEWWQSNNLGARSRVPTSRTPEPGTTRVLVLGESFAHGSRVPQDMAWPSIMDASNDDLEVVNLAVDGYSMGQSLLRFRQIRPLLEYQLALAFFVPDADLWREINVVRDMGESGWRPPLVMPRMVLRNGELDVVPPLYEDPLEIQRRNTNGIDRELHEHLLRYDRFYFPLVYRAPPLLDRLVTYKLAVVVAAIRHGRRVRAGLIDPEGEALQLSRATFHAMRDEAGADGAAFVLAILPIERKWRAAPDREAWVDMVAFLCADLVCIDLLEDIRRLPVDEVDYAHDGSHYGPRMNAYIASSVMAGLRAVAPAVVSDVNATPDPASSNER